MNISLTAFAPENLSRETGSAVPSRVSLLIYKLRLNLVLTDGIPPEFHSGVISKRTSQGIHPIFKAVHALYIQQPYHSTLSFYVLPQKNADCTS